MFVRDKILFYISDGPLEKATFIINRQGGLPHISYSLIKNSPRTKKMFHEFIVKCRALGHTLDIQHLVLDFELAVVKAYRHFFKDVTPRYCQFHFGQNINKKLRTFKGTPGYKDLHLCVSLSSLPADSVTESFLEVKKLIGSYSRSGKFIIAVPTTFGLDISQFCSAPFACRNMCFGIDEYFNLS